MTCITYDEFISLFDDDETSALSHLNLPDDPSISRPKIEQALLDAYAIWLGWFYVDQSTAQQLPVFSGNCKTCVANIARYNLEYLNPREDTVRRYELCYQIARDYHDDQARSGTSPQDQLSASDPVMSIFTI